jgi:hypothetical protein
VVTLPVLLCVDSSRARTDSEKQQADEVYRVVVPGARIVVPSLSKYMAYQVGTSRYQLREKPRQSQRFLKVATMPVSVRTA